MDTINRKYYAEKTTQTETEQVKNPKIEMALILSLIPFILLALAGLGLLVIEILNAFV